MSIKMEMGVPEGFSRDGQIITFLFLKTTVNQKTGLK